MAAEVEVGFMPDNTSKVLQRLGKMDYVKPVRGPKGGFVLGKPSKKINMLEIYELIDGPIAVEQCLLGTYICGGDKCILGNLLYDINIKVKKYLDKTKISDLIPVCRNLESKEKK